MTGGVRFLCILAATNDGDGNLSPMAEERAALGAALYRDLHGPGTELGAEPGATVLATGGIGPGFNPTAVPHNHYLRRRLVALGVPDAAIVTEGLESRHTVDDAALISLHLGRHSGGPSGASLLVVTSGYHRRRASLIFRAVMPSASVKVVAPPPAYPVPDDLLRHEEEALAAILARGHVFVGEERFPLPA